MTDPLSIPKKQKMNEAGDPAPVPLPMPSSSRNDELETISDLPPGNNWQDVFPNGIVPMPSALSSAELESMLSRVVDLSFAQKSRSGPSLSRSDMSQDWRRSDDSGSRFFPLSAKNLITSMPTKKPVKNHILTGPDDEMIRNLVEETGYTLSLSPRQRNYGGPPPGWTGPEPGKECQVFVGKVPKQLFEDTLVPLFEKAGRIYEMRIMMEGAPSVISRGFLFVVYTTPAEARRAEAKLDNFEILPGYHIKVAVSEPICRLFICQIPKHLTEDAVEQEIMRKFTAVTTIQHKSSKGYCFVTFKDHLSAAMAKKLISNGTVKLFKVKVGVDFADQIPEPDEKAMSEVKAVHVKGIRSWYSEGELEKIFKTCGEIEQIRKLPSYAFIHFKERSGATTAIEKFHNAEVLGSRVQVTLAKPPVDPALKQEALIRRAKRLENQRKGNFVTSAPHVFSNSGAKDDSKYIVVHNGVVISDGKRVVVIKQG